MYSCDAGLLVTSIYKDKTLNVEDIYKKLIFGKINSNFGKIFESIISQTLISNGYTPFYHTYILKEAEKEKHYEIDFMFERAGKIVAIEVKSGSNFTTSSLNNLKIKYPQLKFERIVISNKALSEKDSVRYLPIYMAFIL
jgi:predicted AAA+ superfamily ATPase